MPPGSKDRMKSEHVRTGAWSVSEPDKLQAIARYSCVVLLMSDCTFGGRSTQCSHTVGLCTTKMDDTTILAKNTVHSSVVGGGQRRQEMGVTYGMGKCRGARVCVRPSG